MKNFKYQCFNQQKCPWVQNSVTLPQQTERWRKGLRRPLHPLVVNWYPRVQSTSRGGWWQMVGTCGGRNDSVRAYVPLGNEITTYGTTSHEILIVLCALLGHEITCGTTCTRSHDILRVLCALLGHEITKCFTTIRPLQGSGKENQLWFTIISLFLLYNWDTCARHSTASPKSHPPLLPQSYQM